ncbi:MAG TPA: SRPBCC family protein [Candidatus Didemnitutus sp.]|nr:SRPBCC family protein [Candidatus Didemnitutus sp.]
MFKKIIVGIIVVLGLFAIVVAFQPNQFAVTRSAVIATPPSTVYGMVNDFHTWDSWSPWAKLDPNMKTTFAGPAAGNGAEYHWVGDSKVGEGNMKILDSRPAQAVHIQLDFIKPFASSCDCNFTFAPQAGGTLVTWTMSGPMNFVSKAMCMFVSMDKMVGGDFERGLANIKAIAEKK